MNLYGEIILNSEAVEIDRPFTYKIPNDLSDKISIGQIVKVPFGFRSKPTEGFIISVKKEEDIELNYKVKDILSIITEDPIISKKEIELIYFLKERYLCKYIDAFRLLIPVGIMKGAKNKVRNVVFLVDEDISGIKNNQGYKEIIDILKKCSGEFTKSELMKKYNISQYRLNNLIQKGILKIEEEIVYRYNEREYSEDNKKKMTVEQQLAVDKITSSDNTTYLLKGVTGSGKTEIYMRLVEKTLAEGKSSIILVPEIALTPQMIERFKGRFGKNVALFHSKLSDGERFDEWHRVKDGKARVIVGARSALFLPSDNLGLIIIDEEHENTYKSEQNPKYQTKEVAEYIASKANAKLILGSATPTIETYYRAISGEIELIELTQRVDGKPMPVMDIVDMREELRSGNRSLFSKKLYNNIQEALNNKEQIVLFLNRRGFSTFVSCRSCGYVFNCDECEISMTYHKNGFLVCHYCGKTKRVPDKCPKCGSKYVKFFGAGTQRVEEEIKKYFKEARIVRMDVDTTRTKDSHERLYNLFKNGEADILVGTQMVSKGLDFPNVTLVGILAADMSINIPDYRAAERTFQIVTQVAGRAGRGTKEGKVVIQTYTPNHYSLEYAQKYDYEGFYDKEFTLRALMKYPPFGKILLINGVSKNEPQLKEFMKNISENITEVLKSYDNIELLGPIPCMVAKIKDNYRWQIVLKGEFDNIFAKKIQDLLYDNNKSNYNEIRISIDINPNNLI